MKQNLLHVEESEAERERRLAAEREFHNRKFGEAHEHGGSASIYALPKAAYRFMDRELESLADGAEILEYGCGDSSSLHKLSAWGGRVTAIDISDEAIAAAQRIAKNFGYFDQTTFACMNAEDLTFPDDSFDVVVGRAILHHLDLDKAYRSLARVLRPGGTAIFLEPLGHNPLINLYRHFTPHLRTEDEHPLMMADIDHARQYFEDVKLEYFTLLSMGTLVFAKAPALWEPTLRALDSLDSRLFKAFPSAGRWAWTVGIKMQMPRKN